MSSAHQETCPNCGGLISATAPRCRHCGQWFSAPVRESDREWLDEEEDRPLPRRRRPQQEGVEATDFLVPMNVSGWAIASCYLGLIGFCLPIVGLIFAIPAFICGIIAIRKPRQKTSYGSVTGNIRAIIGLVLSSLAIVAWSIVLLVILFNVGR